MANFPLRCLICSKDHGYSDMSHLLTHISSKGHLAAQFNASVRGSQDPVLAQQLKEYNRWFLENNLAQLLAERMSRKDEKKSGSTVPIPKTGRIRGKRDGKAFRPKNGRQRNKNNANGEGDTAIISAIPIDPSMSSKEEIEALKPRETYPKPLDTQHFSSERAEDGRTWPQIQPEARGAYGEHQDSDYSWSGGPDNTSQNSAGRAYFDIGTLLQPGVNSKQIKEDHLTPKVMTRDSDEQTVEDRTISSKLKGTVWPGMNLFDAASPEGKRMRNQRKNYEVMSTLEGISETIKPMEVIYYAGTWGFKEHRVINGEVQSPPPSDAPSPRKRRKRGPLLRKNPNQKLGNLVSPKAMARNKNIKIKQEADDEYMLQDSTDSRGTAYPWANSTSNNNATPSREISKFDMFRENWRPQPSSRLTSAYSNNSDYSFIPPSYPAGLSCRSINDYQPDHLPYFTSRYINQYRLDSGQQRAGTRPVTPSRHPRAQDYNDLLSTETNHRLPVPSNSLSGRSSIPPLGSFGHTRSILHRQETNNMSADHNTTASNHSLREPVYSEHRQCEIPRGFALGMDLPMTPSKARIPFDHHPSRYGDVLESSGDETIDQGIDDSPMQGRTRPALQGLNGGCS